MCDDFLFIEMVSKGTPLAYGIIVYSMLCMYFNLEDKIDPKEVGTYIKILLILLL